MKLRVESDDLYCEKKELNPSGQVEYWTKKERYKWMAAVFFGCAGLYASRTIMPLCSVAIGNELKWNKQQMGTALGAFFWGYMLTQVLGGYLSDQIGGEHVITLCAFGWAFVTLAFPYIPDLAPHPSSVFRLFVFARVLLGICQGFHYPSMISIVARRVHPHQRQFTYCFQGSGAHLGTLLCGSLGTLLTEAFGWRVLFYSVGMLSLLWTIVTRQVLLRRTQRVIAYPQDTRQYALDLHPYLQQQVLVVPAPTTQTQPSRKDGVPWCTLLRHPAFWAMLFGHFTHSNSFCILFSWLPSYFHDNFPDARAWVFNVVPWLITIPSVLISGWIADRLIARGVSVTFVRKLMASVVLLGTAIFLLLLSQATSYYAALTCMALAIASCGFHNSGILINPQDLAPRYGGSVYGLMSMVGAIPGFAGVYLAGYILDTTHSWPIVFNLTAALCLAGWVVYLALGSGQRLI